MDLTTLSETELKALGFDQLKLAQMHQNNLVMVEQELARRAAKQEQITTEKEESND